MGEEQLAVRIVRRINGVSREAWDSLVRDGSPFMRWDWLDSLEATDCVCDKTGWAPHHLVVERGKDILGACPMYLKSHSMGEFVFDHQWASYAMQAGIQYYPKMLVGVPFTPVAGSRFLTAPGVNREGIIAVLGRALVEICRGNELSSIHINFCDQDEMEALEDLDFIPKIGLQFHWQNRDYDTFDDYLGAFRSDRRNKIKRERRELDNQGIQIRALPYDEITPDIQRTMFELYKHHIDRLYYGHQYLKGRFFDELLKRPYPFLCPIVAQRDGRIIAGTFNIRGPDALYGRYWGSFEEHRYLHFNVCYYAAIEHCIDESLVRFEAGAGGSFKTLRGLEAAKTYSAHYVSNKRFREALERYLREERSETLARQEYLLDGSPLKKEERD
ncbi:MAG: GNAT family N-acetyltransferase [Deltaproteobacteria bacterium]|nr:GNAT family N-acetyltransferase [Deltaproteobacteria bacterium]